MLDKIERIARIKRVENDVTNRFDRKSGFKEKIYQRIEKSRRRRQ